MPRPARCRGSRASTALSKWQSRCAAKRLPTGVFPLARKAYALARLREAFPGAIEDCGDALSAALMNAGPIIHPPLIIMNAGPLQHFERWDIHKEGTQPAIRRATDALDGERIAVREALGYGPPHFPLANHYAREGEEWMYGRGSHDRLTDSGDWREHIALTQHRYMLEDTRMGLSFLISVADLAGVRTPLARAFLAIGSAVCGEDFMQSGRTLASLGPRPPRPPRTFRRSCAQDLRERARGDRVPRCRPDGARHRRRVRLCRA